MSAQNAQTKPDELTDDVPPIALLTENDFLVVRRWEADHEPQPVNGFFPFLVTDPGDQQTSVIVQISDQCIQALAERRRLPLSSAFWVICAERHLAEFLWEHDDLPDGHGLVVDCLDPEETILAARWARQPHKPAPKL